MDNASNDLPLIIPLNPAQDQARENRRPLAGMKAARLGELNRAGFRVPSGFVLTTASFTLFMAENNLTAESSLEAALVGRFPVQVETALTGVLAEYEDTPLAVRSSAANEDLPVASFAGQYETRLNVRGVHEVLAAIRECWASAFSPRLAEYRRRQGTGFGSMAVLIQKMIPARAAGVAFSANPLNGDRAETVVQAVEGLADRLVAGQVTPDEWIVCQEEIVYQSAPGQTLTGQEVLAVAALARQAEAFYSSPQEIEWAFQDEELFLLQARPITALPLRVEWKAPLPGGWTRNFRLGEWLPDPVSPLFESWLLERLEDRLCFYHRAEGGAPIPTPVHLTINGWYFFSANFFPDHPLKMPGFMLKKMLPAILRHPRKMFLQVAMLQTSRFGVEPFLKDWREKSWPVYREAVQTGEARVERLTPPELIRLVDEVGEAAGNYLWSLIIVGGFAWKAEKPLADFYKKYLYQRLGGSFQVLLGGLYTPQEEITPGAVYTLDWIRPTYAEYQTALPGETNLAEHHQSLKKRRESLEQQACALLSGTPRLLKRFNRLLAVAQRYTPIREEVVANFTYGWPLLRRAVLRLGQQLEEMGNLTDASEIFFLRREEAEAALQGNSLNLADLAQKRREGWQQQRRLTPPLLIGEIPKMMRPMLTDLENFRSGQLQDKILLKGLPASPGQATGRVRIIQDPAEFWKLEVGEILVIAAATPAWTPFFSRAAALITNVGSPVAHTSLIAREYGLPVVVGTVQATARLRDGQVVTVDGNAGVIF